MSRPATVAFVLAFLAGAAAAEPAPGPRLPSLGFEGPAHAATSLVETERGFDLRLFEVDEGVPIPVLIDPGDWNLFGPGEAERIIGAAVAAWNNIPGSPLHLVIVGTGDAEASRTLLEWLTPGYVPTITVGFVPKPAPLPCLATQGFADVPYPDGLGKKTFGGRSFDRMLSCAAIVYYDTRDSLDTCPTLHRCEFAKTLAHELGHCLGMNHAVGIMQAGTQPFCPCLEPSTTDVAQLLEVYPPAIPPTITTPLVLPPAVVGAPYALQLEATGGTRAFTWSIGTTPLGRPLPPPPGLALSAGGLLGGVPTQASGPGFLMVVAEDSAGASHGKMLQLAVLDEPPAALVTTTTTTTMTLTLEGPPIECFTTSTIFTSTTLPDACDAAEIPVCDRSTCHAALLRTLVASLPARMGKPRRLARAAARAAGHHEPARALRLLGRIERFIGKPLMTRRVPADVTSAIRRRLTSLAAVLTACRDEG